MLSGIICHMCNCLAFSPTTELLFSHHSLCCLPVGTLRMLKGDTAASCAVSKPQLFSHYRMKSLHPILDFRKQNIFLYRINYHLLTINAITLSLLQHDLLYKIRSWVILSREIPFIFGLGQWLFKHLVSAFGTATLSLTYCMLLSSSSKS